MNYHKYYLHKISSLLVAISLIAAMFAFILPAKSHALELDENWNKEIIVQPKGALYRVDTNQNPTGGPITIDNLVKLEFTWDASQTKVEPGQWFYLKLPQEFENRDIFEPLNRELEYQGVNVGNCVIDKTLVKCTFNDQVLGKEQIKGDGYLVLYSLKETTETFVNFDFNQNSTTRVDLPGDTAPAVIGPGQSEIGAWDLRKWSYQVADPSQSHIIWAIGFSGSLTKEGENQATRSIVLHDQFSQGAAMKYSENLADYQLRLHSVDGIDKAGLSITSDQVLATGLSSETDFKLAVTIDNQGAAPQAKLVATGPFEADKNYFITYTGVAVAAAGEPIASLLPGEIYENQVSIQAEQKIVSAKRQVLKDAQINVQFSAALGQLKSKSAF